MYMFVYVLVMERTINYIFTCIMFKKMHITSKAQTHRVRRIEAYKVRILDQIIVMRVSCILCFGLLCCTFSFFTCTLYFACDEFFISIY